MSVTVTAADVNTLRKTTGAGMMDCRKALIESNGNFEEAIDYLRKKGQKVANKRMDREANEGVAIAITNAENNYGVAVRISSETDFVAKNQEFINFAKDVAKVALEQKPSNIDALKTLSMNGISINEKLMEMVGKIGEKIDIVSYEKVNSETVVPYVHGNYRIGVLVGLNKPANEAVEAAGHDVAMQIAAMNPIALDEEHVPAETIAREKAIAVEQIVAEGKPADMAEKIAIGKMSKFFKDNTLLNQLFVKDNKTAIKDYLDHTEKGLTVTDFRRLAIG